MARFLLEAGTVDAQDIPAGWVAPGAPAPRARRGTPAGAAPRAGGRGLRRGGAGRNDGGGQGQRDGQRQCVLAVRTC
ncbi:hypothetical protein G6F59_015710 [Rhizopus arrhizus]|nr:hypothetical protein G6F59_015710 [Rhizopus arrhizus]